MTKKKEKVKRNAKYQQSDLKGEFGPGKKKKTWFDQIILTEQYTHLSVLGEE
jgi:hypothetical protein